MKKAILYTRVSTDEQADKGFSLRDQEQKLKSYCKRNNIEATAIYTDDYSAKTFNRPEFKKLVQFAKTNANDLDELLFIKWDRFSRNTTESYNMIKFFGEMGINVNAIEQPLDLTIPEQGIMLAVYLSMPEVENHRRSLNVISGMRRAYKEGRYVSSPPKGYCMSRDNSNKPILLPNEDSKYVHEAFKLLASGVYNQKEVLTLLKSKGFKTSKTSFGRLIRNKLYCGEIYIKAFKDEKEMVVEGIHEPIVTKALFYKVQTIIDGGKNQLKVAHKKINLKFPLKDFVLCPTCHNPLFASSSKGRSKYYAYYHCVKPCNTRYKLEDAELWFNAFLDGINLDKNAKKLLNTMIAERIKSQSKSQEIGPSHYKKIKDMEDRLNKVQDLFVDGAIDADDFHKTKNRYQSSLEELKTKGEQCNKQSEIIETYKKGLNKLERINSLFSNAEINEKRQLIGSIFPEKFQFEKKEVRTADINPILFKIASVNKGCKGNKKRDKSKKNDLSRLVLKAGLEPARPLLTTGF
jgi:site-specific DNA recombinase